MKEYVDLLGGFSKADWTRNLSEHRTLLKGSGEDRVLVGADNCRLDGFTITGGRTREFGAGLLCQNVAPEIANNRFVDNRTLKPDGWNPENLLHQEGNGGGAIACLGASPVIRKNLFLENKTGVGNGAGILCLSHSSPEIEGNLFARNITGVEDEQTRSSNGGGIGCGHFSSPLIEGNLFLENTAGGRGDAGGVYLEFSSSPQITGNLFVRNLSDDDGAAVYLMKGASPQLSGNVFVGNGREGGGGGTLRLSKACSATLDGNLVMGNPQGGLVLVDANLNSRNNLIAHNGPYGIRISEGALVSSNDTICDHEGKGIELDKGAAFPTNAILAGNREEQFYAQTGRIEIFNSLIQGGGIFHGVAGKKTGINVDIPDTVRGRQNLDADPGFVGSAVMAEARSVSYDQTSLTTRVEFSGETPLSDPAPGTPVRLGNNWGVVRDIERTSISLWGDLSGQSNDASGREILIPASYRLKEDSPCVEAGENLGAPSRDIDGDPRPIHHLTGGRADIGADEYRK
jgi:hypothetical protein